MPLYRKKRLVIEAERFRGTQASAQELGLVKAGERGVALIYGENAYVIDTLEGPVRVNAEDFVVTGIKGERYPVQAEIFHETYEDATDQIRAEQEVQIPISQFSKLSRLQVALDDAWDAISELRKRLDPACIDVQLSETLRNAERSLETLSNS